MKLNKKVAILSVFAGALFFALPAMSAPSPVFPKNAVHAAGDNEIVQVRAGGGRGGGGYRGGAGRRGAAYHRGAAVRGAAVVRREQL